MEKYFKISGTSNKSGASQQKVPAKKRVKRKYKEDCKYGFGTSGSDNHQLPLCIICNLILWNETLVPSKLSRHLETNHKSLKDKPKAYFENLVFQKDKEAKGFN